MTSLSKKMILMFLACLLPLAAQRAGSTSPTAIFKEPPAPPLPGRWHTSVDPTFDTTILQLTDPIADGNCDVAYGMWSVFNSTATRILARCDNFTYVFAWDPRTLGVLDRAKLPESLQSEDAIWSHSDPDLLFHHSGASLLVLNVRTLVDTLVYDASKDLPDGPYLQRMTASENDDVFCWARQTTDWKVVGAACYQRSLGRLLWREPADRTGQYFKVWVDKTGRYLWNNNYYLPPGIESEVFDLQSSYHDSMTNGGPDFSPGHGVQGLGWVIGMDDWNNRDTRRDYSNVHKFIGTTAPSNDWTLGGEYTMLNLSNDFYYVTRPDSHDHTDGLFHDELVGWATDGSMHVRRLAHLHAIVNYPGGAVDYYTMAKPSISYDGRFIAWASNWGQATGLRYIFVVVNPFVP